MDDTYNTLQPPTLFSFALTPAEADAQLATMAAAMAPPAPPIEPQTASDARRRLDVLTADKTWGARYLAGDVAARQEFRALQDKIAAGDHASEALAGAAPPGNALDFSSEDQPSRYVLNETVKMFREAGVSDGAIEQALKGTPETAEAVAATKILKAQRMSDPEWRQKLLNGDVIAKREWMLMSIILAGEAA